MLKYIYLLLKYIQLDTNTIFQILFKIEIQYFNDFKQCCYYIFAGLIIDYKKRIFIIIIKNNI